MSTDKLGLHIVSDDFDPTRLGRPRLVKLVDPSIDFVWRVRAAIGDAPLIIVRWVEPTQLYSGAAFDWFMRHLPAMRAMQKSAGPNIAFEGYNEVPDSLAVDYCQFEVERLNVLHTEKMHACVGNFSVGTPDLPVWQVYKPTLGAMQVGDVISCHEYWINKADIVNKWHCGRWRLVPELDGIPICVTEAGRDQVENQGHAGWKGQCSAEAYLDELRAYGRLLDEFPNVLGATIFTGGRIYPQWKDFDVNEIWGQVVNEYTQVSPKPQPAPEQPTPPKSEPTPQPTGFPVIDRVVLPMRNTGKAWYESTRLFGLYDGHPERAEDYNLESMGNTDLGEPLVAPFAGVVIGARDFGGGHGKVLAILGIDKTGQRVTCRMKHLQAIAPGIWPGVFVDAGQDVGTIGNAGGYYVGAHLHLEIVLGAVPEPIGSWQNETYEFVQPSWWFLTHGIDAATINRITKRDGR